MTHFIFPPDRKDPVADFTDIATSLGLKGAEFPQPGMAMFSCHNDLSDEQIAAFETAGFARADIHCYQILPPPQTDLEYLNLIRSFPNRPSTVIKKRQGWAGMLLYFLNPLTEEEKEKAIAWGFTVTYLPRREFPNSNS